jgi:hypothetical protein
MPYLLKLTVIAEKQPNINELALLSILTSYRKEGKGLLISPFPFPSRRGQLRGNGLIIRKSIAITI